MKELLNTVYSSSKNMIIFYAVLGLIAAIFIVLIILTIKKGKKEKIQAQNANTNNVDNSSISNNQDNNFPEKSVSNNETLEENKDSSDKELEKTNRFQQVVNEMGMERELLSRTSNIGIVSNPEKDNVSVEEPVLNESISNVSDNTEDIVESNTDNSLSLTATIDVIDDKKSLDIEKQNTVNLTNSMFRDRLNKLKMQKQNVDGNAVNESTNVSPSNVELDDVMKNAGIDDMPKLKDEAELLSVDNLKTS